MAHVKKRARAVVRTDGSTVHVTAFQAVWREHPQAPDRTKAFKRRADAERHLVDVQHRLLIPFLSRIRHHIRTILTSSWPSVARARSTWTALFILHVADDHLDRSPMAAVFRR